MEILKVEVMKKKLSNCPLFGASIGVYLYLYKYIYNEKVKKNIFIKKMQE